MHLNQPEALTNFREEQICIWKRDAQGRIWLSSAFFHVTYDSDWVCLDLEKRSHLWRHRQQFCEDCGQPIYREPGEETAVCDDCARRDAAIDAAIHARLEDPRGGGALL
jgi:hypothetical protein